MKISELTLEELKTIIDKAVEEKLKKLLEDPDAGLQLKEHVIERLTVSLSTKEKGIPFDEAKKRIGLK